MFELSRLRLLCVGPNGARYEELLIDLSGIGEPVAHWQPDIFGAGAEALRPSPATVLFLENGAGKTVLLKLIFSVLLPGRRNALGAQGETHVLDNFVGSTDVAHIIIEWIHPETGSKFVTGKILSWKNQTVSAIAENLIEHWYCFRPDDSLNLDNLPMTDGNQHYLAHNAYRELLNEANAQEPRLDLYWPRTHKDWAQRLREHGLDSELFRYQLLMNGGEGEAVEAFVMDSDDKFVDFFLRTVIEERELDELAALVQEHGSKLAQRSLLTEERDFLKEALELLGPLVAATGEVADARKATEESEIAFSAAAARVSERLRRENGLVTQAETEAADAQSDVLKAAAATRQARISVAELKSLIATFNLEDAKRDCGHAIEILEDATSLAAAWHATSVVEDRLRRVGAAQKARELVIAGEKAAEPALAARTAAARHLAHALLDAATTARRRAADEDAAVITFAKSASDAREAGKKARAAAVGADIEAHRVRDLIAAAVKAVNQAVSDGLVPEPNALSKAVREARRTVSDLELSVGTLKRERDELTEAHEAAADSVHQAELEEAACRTASEKADAAVLKTERATLELATNPDLLILTGTEDVDLERDALSLIGKSSALRESLDRESSNIHAAGLHDDATAAHLESRGLIPSSQAAQDACDALAAEGITAWPGWEYISDLPDENKRRDLVRRAPHLLSGVLLNSVKHVDPARKILANLSRLPTEFVAVADTRALDSADVDTVDGIGFALPAHPALYDHDAALAERQALDARRTERGERLAGLRDERLKADELHRELQNWIDHGSSQFTRPLYTAHDTAKQELQTVTARVARLKAEAVALARRREAIRLRIPELKSGLTNQLQLRDQLEELAQQQKSLRSWKRELHAAEQETGRLEALAEQQDALDEAHRIEANDHAQAAIDLRRIAAGHDRRRAELPDTQDVTADDPVQPQPLSVLEDGYTQAVKNFERVQVGQDLRVQLGQAEEEERRAAQAVSALPPEVRESAETLLTLPDGATPDTRAYATEQARRAVESAVAKEGEAREAVGVRTAEARQKQKELDELRGLDTASSITNPPLTKDEALQAVENAETAAAAAEADEEFKEGLQTAAQDTLLRAQGRRQEFQTLIDRFQIDSAENTTTTPFEGTAPDANVDLQRRDRSRKESRKTLTSCEIAEKAAAALVSRSATDDRFHRVRIPMKIQIAASEIDDISRLAPEWQSAMEPRLLGLNQDLAEIEKHRNVIIEHLQAEVFKAVEILRTAQRLSKLPMDLDDWGGKEFIKFVFETPRREHLPARLSDMLDELAADLTEGRARERRNGTNLVVRSLHAAVPKGFRVDILKPDSVLRDERARVSKVKKIFSGGQQLTAAILLYCTMAALRTNKRGLRRSCYSGTLFLDNPIGRANADYLLDLQRSVARSLGVQLIYTTGLFDEAVLRRFPLIIRLRNDADLRAARKYLSVDARIGAALDELGPLDEVHRVTGTRVFRRSVDAGAGE